MDGFGSAPAELKETTCLPFEEWQSGNAFLQGAGESAAHTGVKRWFGQLRWLGTAIAAGAFVALVGGARGTLGVASDSTAKIFIPRVKRGQIVPHGRDGINQVARIARAGQLAYLLQKV